MNLPKYFLLWMLAALCLSSAGAAPLTKVLVIEGASNHGWERRVEIFRSILSRDGSFEMDVTIVPQNVASPEWAAWNPDFSSYDVVLSGYSNAAGGAPWPVTVQTSFATYVQNGGGFVGFHEANQAFTNWPEYQSIIGLAWHDAANGTAFTINPDDSVTVHPPGAGLATGHGARADSLVKRHGLPAVHPIHAGLPDSWYAADLEVVRFPRGIDSNVASNVTILSYATDPDPPSGQPALQHPVEWTVSYGTGRVYASTYGHIWSDQTEPEGMRCAAFQETLVRALKWCAGENPGTSVPSDFPTTAVSIRPYSEGLAGFGGAKPIAPFANGTLPTLSIVPTSVDTVGAFPNLQWESPIIAEPWPASTTDVMIAEMDGRIFRLPDEDTAQPADRVTVLDIQDRVWYMNWDSGISSHKHGGILGAAFHPQFGEGANKDFLYVYYLQMPGDNPDAVVDANNPYYSRLSRFTWDPINSIFDPASELIMIQQFDTAKGHDGGGLVFGGDGFLYLSLGDEGTESDDATPHTQKLDDRVRSGVWRMDVDMLGGSISHAIVNQPAGSPQTFTQGYFIPNTNPWVGVPGALEEYYAVGLREPHRMSYDPVGNRFWIGDVGAGSWEEVDVLDEPGLNFQWNYKEGNGEGFRETPSPLIGTERGPLYQYNHSLGNCIIGGAVYRGTAIPELVGKYLFGDNGSQLYYALEYDPVTKTALSVTQIGQGRAGTIWNGISSFGTDSKGEMFLLQMGAGAPNGGKISRIKRAGTFTGETWEYPPLLSATGLFTNLATLTPAPGMIPFEVNMPLWSSGLSKKRWVMIPNDGVPNTNAERIAYSENHAWQFPVGTVFVKHFARPDNDAPVETRIFVHGNDGWGGVTYKWRAGENEADLVEDGLTEPMTLNGQTFDYLYPSRNQCNQCHQAGTGPVLGFRTRQLNRDVTYPNGITANQITSFSAAGFIPQVIKSQNLTGVITSADVNDPNLSDEKFARSYLDSNCSHCHQPDGSSRAFFDARLITPLTNQSLICGPLIDGLGLPSPAVLKPGSLKNSVLFHRVTSNTATAMPPIARGPVDVEAVSRIANWLLSMNADSCTKSQSFFGGGDLGVTTAPGGTTGGDSWKSNIIIQKSVIFTNTGSSAVTLQLDRFTFHAQLAGDPITPFVVKVNAPDDFTVIAIGTTRTGYPAGANNVEFSDSPISVTVQPGESIAPGFLDANPNGSGGAGPEVIAWTDGGGSVWHGGGPLDNDSGSITLAAAPVPGTNLVVSQPRTYHFAFSYGFSSLQLGNSFDQQGFKSVDGANSNFIVNHTDSFTNITGANLTITVDRFRFHAGRVTDPLTPFIVRINSPGNFTLLAVGDPRSDYVVGNNDLPFSNTPATIVLAPGETIAPGFVDNAPDGTPGSQNGAVSFIYEEGPVYTSDYITYLYDVLNVGATLVVGQPPVVPFPYSNGSNFRRDYLFSISLGLGGELAAPASNPWRSNLVVQKNAIYTNTQASPVSVRLDRFSFFAQLSGEPVTPFVVRMNSPESFTVAAIGTTRTGYSTGANNLPFSDSPLSITLQPGESIAPGFIDANPDGSGGSGAEVIARTDDGVSVWHGGGPLDSDAGSLTVGSPPVPGTNLVTNRTRDYHFAISYIVSSLQMGNNLDQQGYKQFDAANSNFVVNLSESFTNQTAGTLTVSVDRFRFHASQLADPLTPFVVRVNGPGDFTLLAIGDARTAYAEGNNDLPFSGAPATIAIAPGETIAPGFVDNLPDGTPGTLAGAVSFIDGGDSNFYRYDPANSGATLELGQPPTVPFPFPFPYSASGILHRDYLFSITLGFGGKDDEDGDGLKDAWELAFASGLNQLSATLDSDGDGMTDTQEYQAGTDPTDRTSVMKTLNLAPGTGGASALIQTIPGRNYQIRVSVDMAAWIDAGVFKAADWPASETPILVPAATLPPGADQRLFIQIAPSP
jgi:uncharacterized repeat protein (TIGR03806 family)